MVVREANNMKEWLNKGQGIYAVRKRWCEAVGTGDGNRK